MNKKSVLIIVLLSIFLGLFTYDEAYAEIKLPKQTREFYVYDETGIITNEDKNYIITTNENLYKNTSTQIVVAVIKSLEGIPIEDYANSLYREWKIGSKENNNGILMLIAFDDSKIRIEVGYGLEGAIPDITSGQIIKNQIAPKFKEGKYSEGIIDGFNELVKLAKDEYDTKGKNNQDSLITLPRILIVIVIIILIILDFRFFGGILTYSLIRILLRGGRGGGGGSNQGGGGSSGGGGASGGW